MFVYALVERIASARLRQREGEGLGAAGEVVAGELLVVCDRILGENWTVVGGEGCDVERERNLYYRCVKVEKKQVQISHPAKKAKNVTQGDSSTHRKALR